MKRLLVLCSLFLFLPMAGRAAPAAFIGEVAWAGSNASTADEWFELCGHAGADLSGWSIDGAGTGSSTLRLPAGSVIPPRGAFLISNYGNDDAKSTLAAAPDWVTTAVALSNSALFLTLRDASGAIVDTAGQSGAAPFSGNSGGIKASMERLLPLADGATPEAWAAASISVGFDADAAELGTPGICPTPVAMTATAEDAPAPTETAKPAPEPVIAEEIPAAPPAIEALTASATETSTVLETDASSAAPVPTAYAATRPASAVRISEAYPAPNSGEHEWIELINPSDIGEVLDGWTIEDGKGAATALSGTLLPWSRMVIASPKGQLNNDGDLIVLKDASGRALDGVAYGGWDSLYPNVGEVRKGESLIRLELQDVFAVTITPTPDAPNVLVERKAVKTSEQTKNAVPTEAGTQRSNTTASSVTKPPQTDPSTPPSTSSGSAQDDKKGAAVARVIEKETPKAVSKPAVKKPAPKKISAPKYKGLAYVAEVASPPGFYSKTRMYALVDGVVREVRLSKASGANYFSGARIAFVAQEKTEGADPYLLANPNSIHALDASASATFATTEAWPDRAGAFRFNAEVVSMQNGVVEAKLGGIEGDILAPASLTASLKSGDVISIEGYVSPGPRPRAVLARPEALTLFKAYQAEAPGKAPAAKLPWPAAAGLTLVTTLVGTYAYLRHQRLQRLALVLRPVDADEET